MPSIVCPFECHAAVAAPITRGLKNERRLTAPGPTPSPPFDQSEGLRAQIGIICSDEDWLVTKLALLSPNLLHSSTGLKHRILFVSRTEHHEG